MVKMRRGLDKSIKFEQNDLNFFIINFVISSGFAEAPETFASILPGSDRIPAGDLPKNSAESHVETLDISRLFSPSFH